MPEDVPHQYRDRELSWLAFNERVLQEAEDPRVPLFERLFFLGIFSDNLDEFFRVRVASLRSVLRLKKKSAKKLDFNPLRLLGQIRKTVTAQQERFGEAFAEVLAELEQHGVYLIHENDLTGTQPHFVRVYFEETVRPHLDPHLLDNEDEKPFLKNKGLYLVTELWPKDDTGEDTIEGPQYALLEVPDELPRFVAIPEDDAAQHYVLFLDDVIRFNLPDLYSDYDVGASYAVKLSRDAELYVDETNLKDEFEGNLARLIKKSLKKRETGLPCRFLYDLHAPFALACMLKDRFDLQDEDLIVGGRYHNLSDLLSFPRFGMDHLSYEPLPALPHPDLADAPSMIEAIGARDHLWHGPYQHFDTVLRFLQEAAADPAVEAISMTLYRVAKDSAVVEALIEAAERGKSVTAFVEAKARFDEARNLASAERMEEAGVRVLYSMPKLKVHAKILLVARREEKTLRRYAYFGTGNFNEQTAEIYADSGLLTADARLTEDLQGVFDFLTGDVEEPTFEHLLVAPFYLRDAFNDLVDYEIEQAKAGKEARMVLKMNSLEDRKMIDRLYAASQAGVQVRLIVRGLCVLVPGVPGLSENIEVTSILDRYLEHARVYWFHHGGSERLYLASADWMKRNLSRRIEVAFPIYDPTLRREIMDLLHLQRNDNTKARIIDAGEQNAYVPHDTENPVRAQPDTYRYLEAKVGDAVHAG